MKKIVALLLVATILISVSAFAEEGFTLHNGTRFGMNKSEVIETEQQNGFTVKPDEDSLCGKGTIANQPNTNITYSFENNELNYMCYTFTSAETYDAIESGLIKKYGETDYSSNTGFHFPQISEGTGFNRVPFVNWGYPHLDMEYVMTDYSHRLVYISDFEAVFIEHYAYVGYMDGEIYTNGHSLKYHLLTTNELNIVTQELHQLDADL